MLILKELHAKNFRSYKKLDLIDLDKYGLTLITGKNGSGKSSIKHLIEYLLIDTTSDDLPLNELSFNNKGNCEMSCLILRESDNAIIEIKKYRDHKQFLNKTILSVNGNSDDFTTTDRRETQRNIEELLGVNKHTLSISTTFSQSSASFPQLSESDRKDIVYDAISLEKYNDYQNNAKFKIEEIERLLSSIDVDMKIERASIEEIESDLAEFKSESSRFELEKRYSLVGLNEELNKEETKDTSNLEAEYLSLSKESLKLTKENTRSFYKEIIKVESNIEKIESDIGNYKSLIVEKDNIKFINYDNLVKKITELKQNYIIEDSKDLTDTITEKTEQLAKIKADLKEAEKRIQEVSDSMCPILKIECDALMERSDKVVSELQPEIGKLKSELMYNSNELNALVSAREQNNYAIEINRKLDLETVELEHKIELIKKENENADKKVKDINNTLSKTTIEELNKNLVANKQLLEDIKSDSSNFDIIQNKINEIVNELSSIKDKKQDILNKIKEEEQKVNIYISLIDAKTDKLKISKNKIEVLKNKSEKLEDDIKYYEFWKKGYSKAGIPNMKADKFLEKVEFETNKVLSQISNQMYVEIDSQSDLKSKKEVREKISYKIKSPNKTIEDFHSYSGGQKQRILLSDKFAFNNILGKLNFIILDEVLELSLDNEGKEEVIKMLKIRKNIDSIFVVSHDTEIKDKFDKIIEIKLEDGISKILCKTCIN